MNKGFRDKFKYYKRKEVPPDLHKVVNFNKNSENFNQNVRLITSNKLNKIKIFGLIDSYKWEIYEFLNKPGLIFIKNPFTAAGQRYWIIRCLEYYTKKPSKLNIDVHNILKTNENWWDYCHRKINEVEEHIILEKVRWATFGYQHNWDTKVYSETSKCDFPYDLKALCSYIAEILNFPNFNAEAAILNMYHFGSSLSGHTDHSEINVTAPLFSFSFGQSAVFLIGGKEIEDEAIPILLESGDIIVMSGESRLCYHGVPRIVQTKEQPWNTAVEKDQENCEVKCFDEQVINKLWDNQSWECFENYVTKSRINLNVRQVLFPGQKCLDS